MAVWVIIGAIIVTRYPKHPVGWILLFALIAWGLDSSTFGYVSYAQSLPGRSLPGVDVALVWLSWTGFPFALFTLGLLFLLFPNGQPWSAAWGKLRWSLLAGLIVFLVVAPLRPGDLQPGQMVQSPLAVSASSWLVLEPINGLAVIILGVSLVAPAISLILRLRHTPGDEQQQVKWFVFAAAFFPIFILFVAFEVLAGPPVGPMFYVGFFGQLISFTGIAIAISIFRYRLYEIDILINRTLVYGALSAVLVLIYFISVVILQSLLRALTGQESPIAIVASTLLVAAFFQPIRRRLQELIDRRFYRRKYDAGQLLARFSMRLREEVDSDELIGRLLDVVAVSVQPSHASLWLRSSASYDAQE